MGKAIEIAKVSARGIAQLFTGKLFYTAFSAIGALLVAWLLTPEEYGLFFIAFVLPDIIGLFRDWGTSQAITRYSAHFRSGGEMARAKSTVWVGFEFQLLIGSLLSACCFFLADPFAAIVIGKPTATPLVQWASFVILAMALYNIAWSTFLGFDKMGYNTGMLLSFSMAKSVLPPLLVVLGFGALGAVWGIVAAQILTGALFVVAAIAVLRRVKSDHSVVDRGFRKYLAMMLKFGIPLALASMIGLILTQYYYLMISRLCSENAIGNYSVAIRFIALIALFSFPIQSVLFPTFSKLKAETDIEDLKKLFKYAVKYTSLVVIPAAVGLMVISRDVVWTFLPEYGLAPWFLTLSAISALYVGFGFMAIESFLSGQGDTRTVTKLSLVALVIGIPLAALLIPLYGIEGMIYTSLVASAASLAYGLSYVRRRYGVSPDFPSSVKIYLSAALMGAVVYMVSLVGLPSWVRLVLEVAAGAGFYLLAVPLVGTIDRNDVKNMRELSTGLGPLRGIANRLLDFIAYVVR